MRRFSHFLLALVVAATPFAAGASGGGAVKAGPKGIPFSCSDARTLRVVYDGGGMRAKAKLLFDGGEAHELKAAPTPIGRRYTKATADGRLMVWTTNGVDAAIGEAASALSPGSAPAEEREVARCHRARSAEHDGAAHGDAH